MWLYAFFFKFSSLTCTVNQGCMTLSTYYLEYGCHVSSLLLRRRRRRGYAPTSNTASHDDHEKINSWVSFSSLYEYRSSVGGPSGHRSSTIRDDKNENASVPYRYLHDNTMREKKKHIAKNFHSTL